MGTSTARLELRLPAAEKAEIEEAAGLTGRTVTEYVRTAARTDLARSIKVSGEVFDALVAAIESDAPSAPAMVRARARAEELGL